MADKETNPLTELYSDASGTMEPGELSEFLKPFLLINRSNKKIFFTSDGLLLPPKKKIILFLLARKALFLLDDIEEEEIVPKELKREFKKSIPAGTIDGNLKRLSDTGLIRNDNSKYFILDISFPKIKDWFNKK